MRVLITRPVEDSGAFAAALQARGHETLIEPMLVIAPTPNLQGPEARSAVDLNDVQAILFTSANGVRAFVKLSAVRDLPVFAVGEASAQAARDAGFTRVESAGGDVEDLARLASARLSPAEGALFHGAARQVAGDLKGLLEARGFTLRRAILYEAQAARDFSDAARTALYGGEIDAVSFFSPRTAETFVDLIRSAGLAPKIGNSDAVCLSVAVADQVRVLSWRSVRVAARPNQDALLDCIDELAGDRRAAPAEEIMPADTPEDTPSGNEAGGDSAGGAHTPESLAQDSPAHEIIAQFGGIRPMASKLGVAVSTVQGWRERGSIPSARHEQIAAAAQSHGIALDAELLADSDRHPDGHGEPEPGRSDAGQSEAGQTEAGSRHAPAGNGRPWGAASGNDQGREDQGREDPGREDQVREDQSGDAVTNSNQDDPAEAETETPPPGPPGPSAPPEAPKRAAPGRPWAGAFLVAGIVFVAGAGAAVLTRDAWSPFLPGASDQGGARLEALESRLDGLETQAAAAPAAAELKDAQGAIAALRSDLASLSARLSSLGAVAESAGNTEQLGAALARMEGRNAEFESEVAALRAAISETNARLSSLGEVAAAAGDSEQLGAALAKMESRNAELAGEVSALRGELERLAEAGAAPPASESAVALAVLQMRDALRGAEPFGGALNALDAQLSGAAGAEAEALRAAVAPLRPLAAHGAPSLEALQAEFPAVARAVIAQSHGGEGDSMLSNVVRRLSSLVSVRQVGQVEGDSAEAIVARAEAHLKAGALAPALQELDALSGPAAEAAASWRAKAQARVSAQDALAKLGGLLAAGRG